MQQINTKYQGATLYLTILFAALLTSCTQGKVKISGRFVGGDSQMAYLEEITSTDSRVIDSAALNKNGEFVFNFKNKDNHARLYNVVYDWSTIPLFATNGDRITINSVGNIAKNYTISGSEESELIRTFYQDYIAGIQKLDKIAVVYGDENLSEERRKVLAKQYNEEYRRVKRNQLQFIIEQKANLAAVYALYQRLPTDSYLFNGKNDVIYYRTVAEALEEKYPDSPYRKSIQTDVDNFDAVNHITSSIVERGYPDLDLNNMFGQKQTLSNLEGKVILVDFWSAELGNSNQNNAELKELYQKYNKQGFEIYQVGIDNSKSAWINAIQEQKLPWVSVSDLRGNSSPSLTLYNVTRLPSNFIIARDGNLVVRDTYGSDLESRIKAEIAK